MRRHWWSTPLNPVHNATAVVADFAGELSERTFRRLCVTCHAGVVDASRHHRNADDPFQTFVEGRTNDDIGVLIDFFADTGRSFVDLVKREVFAARDRDKKTS